MFSHLKLHWQPPVAVCDSELMFIASYAAKIPGVWVDRRCFSCHLLATSWTGLESQYARLRLPSWAHSLEWHAENQTDEPIPPSNPLRPSLDLEKPFLKHGNDTLLEMAPSYIRSIMGLEDETFPGLACPAPTSDRYLHLKPEFTDSSHSYAPPPKYFLLSIYINAQSCFLV